MMEVHAERLSTRNYFIPNLYCRAEILHANTITPPALVIEVCTVFDLCNHMPLKISAGFRSLFGILTITSDKFIFKNAARRAGGIAIKRLYHEG